MDIRVRPREFFIGRYIYYSQLLESLGKIYLSVRNGTEYVDIITGDKKTGNEKRRRITNKSKEWDKYRNWAVSRKIIKGRIKELIIDYKKEWHGCLSEEAAHYRIRPNSYSRFDNELFDTFTNNQGGVTENHKFKYKGIPMRSEFETEIASIIDDLDITFKYEVKLYINQRTYRLPDFGLSFPEYNRCAFVEYLGALDDFRYVDKNSKKFEEYHDAGIYIGRDIVFIPGEENYRPSKQMINEMIMTMYGEIARMHLVKVN